ncbi:radical SAM family heme chaperone HemW [Nafulsella turpanensis]|uniref:radical SAM family heme chaperone HemW n=1 Tax=Nafulsella turpanensis TaxID=1265690 RepID=UPI00034B26DA|nr:radical SAM family heme chaperone HemW [Nafulsella turpanensis]
MAGIYLHIPFCRQACHYCDFHFSTNLKNKDALVKALVQEIRLQKDYLEGEEVETVYFGGGTPSLLSREEVETLLLALKDNFLISNEPEITLEANPDDLKPEKLQELYAAGINRLSIGIQSFHDAHLQSLNRAHSAREAKNSIKFAREAGFSNISIDLIYAIPSPDDTLWLADLEQALALRPEHISSYCLTIEPQTAFGNWLKKGKLKPIDEEYAARQFEILLQRLQEAGYEQYEISNFCLPGNYSRHNSSYWQQKKYLGLGPSAHSFNGHSRQHNIANNARYLKALAKNEPAFEREELQRANMINEYIMTGLRTRWGCSLAYLQEQYAFDLKAENEQLLSSLFQQKYIYYEDGSLLLTDSGKLLADEIASRLMTEE